MEPPDEVRLYKTVLTNIRDIESEGLMHRFSLWMISIAVASATAFGQALPVTQDSSQQIADKILASRKPVLVEFWAPWCGPCRMLAPIVNELEKEYHGRLLVLRVNVDKNRGLANYFQVSSIPAVFFMKDSAVVDFKVGVQSKEVYRAAIEAIVPKPAKKAGTPVKKITADTLRR
jgi:thioredoxin 1